MLGKRIVQNSYYLYNYFNRIFSSVRMDQNSPTFKTEGLKNKQAQKKVADIKPFDQGSLSLKIKYLKSTENQNIEQGQKRKDKKKAKEQEQKGQEKLQIKPPKGTRDFYPREMAIRRRVMDTVANVFKKHGGVQIDTPVFELRNILKNNYGEDDKLIYDLEDQGGQLLSLRYDLTVPFARFMANNTNIQKIKRFHIGKVYRRDQPTVNKGRYRQFYQCDFDIAGKYDPMIPDAEVLAIMQEILETLGINDFLVKVNHRKILEAMIQQAGCSQDSFKSICSSIDKLDKQPWSEIKDQLISKKGVTEEQAKIIGELIKFKGEPEKLLKQIIDKNVFKNSSEFVNPYFEEMKLLFSYLTAMKRIGKVSFDLSLARGLDYYTGVIFEIVLTDKKNQLGSISGGGRYDGLIGKFCQHEIPSVGGSIGIERLFTLLEKLNQGKVKQNQCEVLVATIKDIPVQQKMAVLAELWRSDIKAETMYVTKGKPDKQLKHAFDNGIPMILWIGETQLKNRKLNMKILYENKEVEINMNNLGEDVFGYVNKYREELAKGNINFQAPKKK